VGRRADGEKERRVALGGQQREGIVAEGCRDRKYVVPRRQGQPTAEGRGQQLPEPRLRVPGLSALLRAALQLLPGRPLHRALQREQGTADADPPGRDRHANNRQLRRPDQQVRQQGPEHREGRGREGLRRHHEHHQEQAGSKEQGQGQVPAGTPATERPPGADQLGADQAAEPTAAEERGRWEVERGATRDDGCILRRPDIRSGDPEPRVDDGHRRVREYDGRPVIGSGGRDHRTFHGHDQVRQVVRPRSPRRLRAPNKGCAH
jgi:hypothetical protein